MDDAELATPTGAPQTGAQRYRLTAPDRRAFDVTPYELVQANALNGPNANEAIGYSLLGRTRAANAQQRYADLLGQTNTQQAALSREAMASENARSILNSRNPGLAYSLSALRPGIAPDSQGAFQSLEQSAVASERGIATEHQAHANQMNTEAGVVPPDGTSADAYGYMPGLRQAAPLNLRVAGVNAAARSAGAGGERLAALNGMATNYAQRAVFVASETNRAERAALAQAGAQFDANGNMIRPPQLSPAQVAEVRQRAEQHAERAASQAFGMMDQIYSSGGRAALVPTRPTTGGAPSPEPSPVAAPVEQPGPPVAGPTVSTPSPTVGPVAPPVAQPMPRPANTANQLTPQQRQMLDRVAPPSAGLQRHLVGNTVQYIGPGGVVVRTVPLTRQ